MVVEVNEDGTVGGSHQVLFDAVRLMDQSRISPVVVFYQENIFAERLRSLGVAVHVLDGLRTQEVRAYRRESRLSRYRGLWRAIRARQRLIRRLRIDLVHINNSPQVALHDWLPAAITLGIPIVASAMGDAGPIKSPLRRLLVRRYSHYLPVSEYMLTALLEQGIPPSRITLVRNGVDAPLIKSRIVRPKDAVRRELGVPPGHVLGVMVGNVRRWKGQDVVLDAMALVPPDLRSRLVIAFAGSNDLHNPDFKQALDQMISDHGIASRIRWLGRRDDVPELFHAADFGLHASVVPEPFGLVMAECMGTGTPVIAAQEGGAAEIVTRETGWVYPGGNAKALSELLARAVVELPILQRFRGACTTRAQEFSAERMAAEMEAVYLKVTARRARS